MNIKVGDTVVLLTGKYNEKFDDKGNVITHKVIAVSPKEDKVIVEGVNKVKKHVKARRQGENSSIVETDGAIYACKVALYCDKCGKLYKEEIPNFCEDCGNPLADLKNKTKKRCICDDLLEKGEDIPDYCPECGKPLKIESGE